MMAVAIAAHKKSPHSWTSIAPGVRLGRVTRGRCNFATRNIVAKFRRATSTTKIAKRQPARSSRSFQKTRWAPVSGPTGGAKSDCRGRGASACSWSGVMGSLLLAVLGVALQAGKIAAIAAGDGVARHELVERLTHEAGHRVVAQHPHDCFRRALRQTRGDPFELPALQAFDAVLVAESPCENACLLQCGYARCVRDFARAE